MLAVVAVLALAGSVDYNSVLRLVGDGAAHACPVTEHLALTAKHVGYDEEGKPQSYRFDTRDGVAGTVTAVWRSASADLAMLYTEARLRAYTIAGQQLQPGDALSLLGYDWRKEENAYGERVWLGELLRVRAGHLVFKHPGEGGSSGSCVFNSAGEVEAINVGVKSTQDQKGVGVAVSVVGAWSVARAVLNGLSLAGPQPEGPSDAVQPAGKSKGRPGTPPAEDREQPEQSVRADELGSLW